MGGNMSGYFFIKSGLNGLVLDVQGGGQPTPGTPVIMWNQKHHDNGNQLFCEDLSTSTIRSKDSNMCLEVQGGRLVVNHFYPGNPNQQWMFVGQHIQNRFNPSQVLDIADNNSSPGATVCSYNNNGQANQKWSRVYAGHHHPSAQPSYPTAPAFGRPHFYVKSQMHGLVLDAEHGSRSPGTRLIMWNQKFGGDADNQLFYEDHMTGTIKSKASNLCIELQGSRVILNNCYPGNANQQWMIFGEQIAMRNNPSQVLDIANGDREPGAGICAWSNNGQVNQKWRIEHA